VCWQTCYETLPPWGRKVWNDNLNTFRLINAWPVESYSLRNKHRNWVKSQMLFLRFQTESSTACNKDCNHVTWTAGISNIDTNPLSICCSRLLLIFSSLFLFPSTQVKMRSTFFFEKFYRYSIIYVYEYHHQNVLLIGSPILSQHGLHLFEVPPQNPLCRKVFKHFLPFRGFPTQNLVYISYFAYLFECRALLIVSGLTNLIKCSKK
jgi:hypothetical protein